MKEMCLPHSLIQKMYNTNDFQQKDVCQSNNKETSRGMFKLNKNEKNVYVVECILNYIRCSLLFLDNIAAAIHFEPKKI